MGQYHEAGAQNLTLVGFCSKNSNFCNVPDMAVPPFLSLNYGTLGMVQGGTEAQFDWGALSGVVVLFWLFGKLLKVFKWTLSL